MLLGLEHSRESSVAIFCRITAKSNYKIRSKSRNAYLQKHDEFRTSLFANSF